MNERYMHHTGIVVYCMALAADTMDADTRDICERWCREIARIEIEMRFDGANNAAIRQRVIRALNGLASVAPREFRELIHELDLIDEL